MAKRKTTSEFKDEVFTVTKGEYTVLGEYINRVHKIKLKHNVCGNEYLVAPTNFLGGERCPRCSYKARRVSPSTFSDWFTSEVGDEYTQLSPYTRSSDKILVKHNLCGNKYEVTPNNFKRGRRCPFCKAQALVKTDSAFKKQVKDNYNDALVIVDKYRGVDELVTALCKKHNCKFSAIANSLVQKKVSCPICKNETSGANNSYYQYTKGEQNILAFLLDNHIDFIYQKMFTGCKSKYKLLPFDFYLPDKNLIIEYDGRQHYESVPVFGGDKGLERTQRNDETKNEYAISNDISMVRIPYSEKDILGVVNSIVLQNVVTNESYLIN